MQRTFLLGLFLILSTALAAEEQPACFCLENPGTKMIERYGCEARMIETRGIERVFCQRPDFDGRERVDDHARFTRIPDGEGRCLPCYATKPGEPDGVIRQPNGGAPESEATEVEASE